MNGGEENYGGHQQGDQTKSQDVLSSSNERGRSRQPSKMVALSRPVDTNRQDSPSRRAVKIEEHPHTQQPEERRRGCDFARSEDEEEEYESSEGEVITKTSSSGEVFLQSGGAGGEAPEQPGHGQQVSRRPHEGEGEFFPLHPSVHSRQHKDARGVMRSEVGRGDFETGIYHEGRRGGSKRRALWHAASVAGATVALAGTSAMNSMKEKWREARSKSKGRRGEEEEEEAESEEDFDDEGDGGGRADAPSEKRRKDGAGRGRGAGTAENGQGSRATSRIPLRALYKRVSMNTNPLRYQHHPQF